MTTPSSPLDDFTALIARLMADLAHHEAEAARIRSTLADLRRQLAATGPRAGKRARSGRKRKRPVLEVTDLTHPETEGMRESTRKAFAETSEVS